MVAQHLAFTVAVRKPEEYRGQCNFSVSFPKHRRLDMPELLSVDPGHVYLQVVVVDVLLRRGGVSHERTSPVQATEFLD